MLQDNFDQKFLTELRRDTTDFLVNLCAIPSISNQETEACEYAFEEFSKIDGVVVRKLPMDNSLKDNPLWCSGPYGNNDYTGHFNVEVVWEGTGEQDPVYLCAHIDTVTVSENYKNLLTPVLDGDTLHALGANDV